MHSLHMFYFPLSVGLSSRYLFLFCKACHVPFSFFWNSMSLSGKCNIKPLKGLYFMGYIFSTSKKLSMLTLVSSLACTLKNPLCATYTIDVYMILYRAQQVLYNRPHNWLIHLIIKQHFSLQKILWNWRSSLCFPCFIDKCFSISSPPSCDCCWLLIFLLFGQLLA